MTELGVPKPRSSVRRQEPIRSRIQLAVDRYQ
jgi:hypothetical protein